MKLDRRKARSIAFQTLFELASRADRSLHDALDDRVRESREERDETISASTLEYARSLVQGVLGWHDELNDRIARLAPAFPINQMARTDRVALELAIYELLWERGVPVRVVINEAVDIAKTFGGENSGRFVNGVLGTIAEELDSRG